MDCGDRSKMDTTQVEVSKFICVIYTEPWQIARWMKCDVADPWMQGFQADGLGMAGLLGDH